MGFKNYMPKCIMYKKLMYICFFKTNRFTPFKEPKNEKFTIVQRKFKHHNHEIAGGKRQNVWL